MEEGIRGRELGHLEEPKQYKVSWSEGGLWASDPKDLMSKKLVGELGNSNYPYEEQAALKLTEAKATLMTRPPHEGRMPPKTQLDVSLESTFRFDNVDDHPPTVQELYDFLKTKHPGQKEFLLDAPAIIKLTTEFDAYRKEEKAKFTQHDEPQKKEEQKFPISEVTPAQQLEQDIYTLFNQPTVNNVLEILTYETDEHIQAIIADADKNSGKLGDVVLVAISEFKRSHNQNKY
jgi:hypothetical protein